MAAFGISLVQYERIQSKKRKKKKQNIVVFSSQFSSPFLPWRALNACRFFPLLSIHSPLTFF